MLPTTAVGTEYYSDRIMQMRFIFTYITPAALQYHIISVPLMFRV